MTDKIALWKRRISERKAKGQTIVDWCEEHNITKDTYHYWRKQVKYAEGTASKSTSSTKPITFVEVKTTGTLTPTLQVTWQDVNIQFTSNQEAHLAAEMIMHLRKRC